jgi:hypothetical protein
LGKAILPRRARCDGFVANAPLHAGDVSQQNQTPDPDRGSDSLVLNSGSMPPNQRLGTDDVKRL